MELWEIATQKNQLEYLNDCDINADVNIADLWDYLMFEYEDMGVIDSNSQRFHERVKNFFAIHKWNIDELVKTLNYTYEPLETNKWVKGEKTTEDNKRERGKEWDRKYAEQGSNSETDVNFVSAYNDDTSPKYLGLDGYGNPIFEYNDEEHDRRTISKSYRLSGEEDGRENELTLDDKEKNQDTNMHGNDGTPYQDLIDKQRSTSQFNIYKWIAKHFCKELLIAVW